MLEGIEIAISGVWSILSVRIPLTDGTSFTLWQYFFFIIIACVLVKQLFGLGGGGGEK